MIRASEATLNEVVEQYISKKCNTWSQILLDLFENTKNSYQGIINENHKYQEGFTEASQIKFNKMV